MKLMGGTNKNDTDMDSIESSSTDVYYSVLI